METGIEDTLEKKKPKRLGFSFLQNFTSMYNLPSTHPDANKRCLIMPGNKMKFFWDFYIVSLLLFVSIVVPFRLAFYNEDSSNWVIIYILIDSQFLIDIIFTFFSAYVESDS